MTTVAVLGTGNMAGAVARRLADADPELNLRLTTRTRVPAWAEGREHVEHRALENDPNATAWALDGADFVIIGVKPVGVIDLLTEIGPTLKDGAVVISVAAGVRLAPMRAALPAHAGLVRTMPNTPTAIGQGVTAVAIEEDADPAIQERAVELLAPTGLVEALPEAQIDAFSAVCGSGPAYAYYLVEALRAGAERVGLPADVAARTVPAMLAGSLSLLEDSGEEPTEMRRQVTSPGGSTAEGIRTFDERNLTGLIADALEAARVRNVELGA
ncbi:pyrroline-5-carboxylate reductase [Demequina sediminicola]|uniref:pyrroline-5-carboxylate reductase n=1 Tax=Demequina sediminicola TaxID=1095026 RepID=UPI000A928540|nr:pyrroline-5-carboxylate reductase [Demequina sediminicola]